MGKDRATVLVVDGQGGQLGSRIIQELAGLEGVELLAVGTNATAAAAMRKAGAHQAAAGENPVVVACRRADVIVGPIGMVIADAMLGEVTPNMAAAIGQADAVRVLIPMNKCENLVAGVNDQSMAALIQDGVAKVKAALQTRC